MSHDIHVMCDYPQAGQSFQRGNYHELDWFCNRGDQYDPDRHADIPIKRAGTFYFHYFATDDHDELVAFYCAIFEINLTFQLVHWVRIYRGWT